MNLSDACMRHLNEVHVCPHCQTRMSCCHVPPFHIGDGLGWGTEIYFLCLNDHCPLYVNGWAHIEQHYGQSSSYRYMELPGEKTGGPMLVGGPTAMTGCVIDPDAILSQNTRLQNEKEALAALATCVEERDLAPVLSLLTDEYAHLDGRMRACELLEEIADLSCIDPLRNHQFRKTEVGQRVDQAIRSILKKAFKKECPFCAEIVKSQAKVCKHCGKEDPHVP